MGLLPACSTASFVADFYIAIAGSGADGILTSASLVKIFDITILTAYIDVSVKSTVQLAVSILQVHRKCRTAHMIPFYISIIQLRI